MKFSLTLKHFFLADLTKPSLERFSIWKTNIANKDIGEAKMTKMKTRRCPSKISRCFEFLFINHGLSRMIFSRQVITLKVIKFRKKLDGSFSEVGSCSSTHFLCNYRCVIKVGQCVCTMNTRSIVGYHVLI